MATTIEMQNYPVLARIAKKLVFLKNVFLPLLQTEIPGCQGVVGMVPQGSLALYRHVLRELKFYGERLVLAIDSE